MKGWWEGMDLSGWCVEPQVGSAAFDFAVALANERARQRGVRQRVTHNSSFAVSPFSWLIADVAQPRLQVVAS